jgi:hypothetical protein
MVKQVEEGGSFSFSDDFQVCNFQNSNYSSGVKFLVNYVKKNFKKYLSNGRIYIINLYQNSKQVTLDCECEAQAINHHSTVGRSREAAEQVIKSFQGLNGRQLRATERNFVLIDGTICKPSETSLRSRAEEASILSIP